jgi:hypothetical protein
MVVVSEKVGTLCIEYRPSDTMFALSDDECVVDETDCNIFILNTKFFPGYVPFLPIYSLDPRCYSQLRIKCFSVFDALDFIEHLDLQEFDFKFVPAKIYDPINYGREFDIEGVEFEGSLSHDWSMRITVAQREEYLLVSNREDSRGNLKDLKIVYPKG